MTLRPIIMASIVKVNAAKFQEKLLPWFAKHKRSLPWRLKPNPYRIFVVEVMLQQTQIKTVIPYYERWVKTFPNVHALARAPLDRVLKLWEGLGYYTRARNLHKAAREIVRRFGGKIPSDPTLLQSLPGIGRYTAGAIASIAYDQPVPLVDGNVARVLSRLFNLKEDISKPETQSKLYELANALVPKKEAGAFNQALMELGSLVCIPEAPRCSICPVQALCIAFQKGDPKKLPIRSKGVRVKRMKMAVGILRQNGRILVRRRPERGIWGGLWEIPGTVFAPNQSPQEALVQEFKEALGIEIKILRELPPIEHRFTHRNALIHAFLGTVPKGTDLRGRFSGGQACTTQNHQACPPENRPQASLRSTIPRESPRAPRPKTKWADRSALKALSFPVPHQKILWEFAKAGDSSAVARS